MTTTLDKLVHAIQTERTRRGGEGRRGRRVFLEFGSSTDLGHDLTAREAAGFFRSEKNREELRRRLGAESVKYRPSEYHRASGGGHDVGFVKYRTSPARRDPPSVFVKFGETAASPAHAIKKSNAQLDREIAAALAGHATDDDEGVFYLTDTQERPLGPEFPSRLAAKRAAMKLVRERAHPRIEVWHRWRGGRYMQAMQGLASAEGWSDV